MFHYLKIHFQKKIKIAHECLPLKKYLRPRQFAIFSCKNYSINFQMSHHPFLSSFRDLIILFRQLVDCCNHRANQEESLPRDAVWTVITGHWPQGIPVPAPVISDNSDKIQVIIKFRFQGGYKPCRIIISFFYFLNFKFWFVYPACDFFLNSIRLRLIAHDKSICFDYKGPGCEFMILKFCRSCKKYVSQKPGCSPYSAHQCRCQERPNFYWR